MLILGFMFLKLKKKKNTGIPTDCWTSIPSGDLELMIFRNSPEAADCVSGYLMPRMTEQSADYRSRQLLLKMIEQD